MPPFPKPTRRKTGGRKLRPVTSGHCQSCGKTLVRRVYPTARESAVKFEARRFCNQRCRFEHAKASRVRTKPCLRCGAMLPHQKPYAIKRRRFCSRVCATSWARERNPKRGVCVVCGTSMVDGRIPGKTCSKSCGYILRKSKLRSMRPCDHCGKDYWPNANNKTKFCSRACHLASVANRPALLRLTCPMCGAGFRRTRAAVARSKHSFCGPACARQFNRGANSHMFRGDKDPNRGGEWKRLAASVRERDCYSCRRCGLCETGNGQKLSVDHVRPWRSFEDKQHANHPSNLVSLCRPCHSFKTTVVEKAWLRGDVMAFQSWMRSLFVPSARWSGHESGPVPRRSTQDTPPQPGLFTDTREAVA